MACTGGVTSFQFLPSFFFWQPREPSFVTVHLWLGTFSAVSFLHFHCENHNGLSTGQAFAAIVLDNFHPSNASVILKDGGASLGDGWDLWDGRPSSSPAFALFLMAQF